MRLRGDYHEITNSSTKERIIDGITQQDYQIPCISSIEFLQRWWHNSFRPSSAVNIYETLRQLNDDVVV